MAFQPVEVGLNFRDGGTGEIGVVIVLEAVAIRGSWIVELFNSSMPIPTSTRW